MLKVKSLADINKLREEESLRLSGLTPGLSIWQRFAPFREWQDPLLREIEAYLDSSSTRALFDEHEASESYPSGVLAHLWKLGLADLFSPRGRNDRLTFFHMCALGALTSRRDTSVAVTLSVSFLGLLPIYLAGNPEQIVAISERVQAGNFAALLLSEWEHGSNILRNQARGVRGILDPQGRFKPISDGEPCTHYELHGEKDLINGGTHHGILCACLRTRNLGGIDPAGEIAETMRARGDFTLFWLDRGPGMVPVPRFRTHAGASSWHFRNTPGELCGQLGPRGRARTRRFAYRPQDTDYLPRWRGRSCRGLPKPGARLGDRVRAAA